MGLLSSQAIGANSKRKIGSGDAPRFDQRHTIYMRTTWDPFLLDYRQKWYGDHVFGDRPGYTLKDWAFAHACWNLDGCVMNAMYTCNAGRSLVFASKDFLENELDVPTLVLEWDCMDKRDYSTEAVGSRVQTFAELLRLRPQRRKPTLNEILKHYEAMGIGDSRYQPGMLKETV